MATHEDRLDRIEDKLDKMLEQLAEQAGARPVHLKRISDLESRIEPLEKHVSAVNGVVRFLGIASVVATIVLALKKLMS